MEDYINRLQGVKTEQELFDLWKTKPVVNRSYIEKDKTIPVVINHSDVFVSDGIVNEMVWNNNSDSPRILFVLKEAYGGENDWSLTDELQKKTPWSSIWRRVTEWTYGILNTTAEKIAKYEPDIISMEADNKWLNRIAVINLKKSSGRSSSKQGEIEVYAAYDRLELKKQIEIIDADIIVCGSTFSVFNSLYDNKIKTENNYCDNWYYFTDEINGKNTLVIDYYHPANYYPALLNYYGLVSIYHQALISKNNNSGSLKR